MNTFDLLGFRAEVDETAGAVYITISDQQVFKTKCFGDRVNVDVDHNGQPVGIEILE